MKKEIITLVIGVFVGAIIATSIFLAIQLTNTNTANENKTDNGPVISENNRPNDNMPNNNNRPDNMPNDNKQQNPNSSAENNTNENTNQNPTNS
ncbi:MAG: hypothetical protein IJ093_03130 [Bacilli bacterium]|nr:hypothetical protein [Bacilli bacterium]